MSQGKRFLRALSRIGYPKANEYEGDNFEWLFDCESLTPFLEWFCENIHEENVLSHDDLKRWVKIIIYGLCTCRIRRYLEGGR